jgi:CDGSH-type Zn-finger protein
MATEDVVIVPYRDGPYLVRGPLILRDQDGQRIELSRRTVALCRCGKSRMRPFCDGTHRLVQFQAPSGPERPWNETVVPASEHAGNGHAPAPRDSGVQPAIAGLRRARRRVAALLDAPCSAPGHAAVRAALPLIDGADRLLEAGAQSSLAALHLVKGAFGALGDAAGLREPGVAAAAAELAAVAVALEPQNGGSWRF